MKNILAALGLTSIDVDAAAPAFSHHEVVLSKDGVAGTPVSTTDTSITFTNLDPGTYVATAVSLDTAGNPMSPMVTSAPVVIDPVVVPPNKVDVVTSITLTLG